MALPLNLPLVDLLTGGSADVFRMPSVALSERIGFPSLFQRVFVMNTLRHTPLASDQSNRVVIHMLSFIVLASHEAIQVALAYRGETKRQ
jgi:hypothetical protein